MTPSLLKRHRSVSVLGLAFDGNRLHGVVLQKRNGGLIVRTPFVAELALNPLTSDPELAGREIRNALDKAGVRERRCVLCIPLTWAITVAVTIPDLPEADVTSFLQIEAERSLPFGQEAAIITQSRYRLRDGKQHALLVAVPRERLDLLERALQAAQLRPVSFTLGISALQPPNKGALGAELALRLDENRVELQITGGGGVAALRSLEGVFEQEGRQKQLQIDSLAREIRITLGQLPAQLRDSVKRLHLFATGDSAQEFAEQVVNRFKQSFDTEWKTAYRPGDFALTVPAATPVSPEVSAAAQYLTAAAPAFEFLPPKTTALQQLKARFSSKKLQSIGGIAAAIALLGGVAFGVQQYQLSALESKWKAIAPRVREVEALQQQIKQFRPWFDESLRSLRVLKTLTEAFPEEGVISAKTLEIRNSSIVTCAGVARDNETLFKILDQLRAVKEISDVKVDQLRGKAPMQFSFNFQWGERRPE